MKGSNDNSTTDQKELKTFLGETVISKAQKLKGKFVPISELVGNVPKILSIKNIYDLSYELKNLYLIETKNYSKQPKVRYFLAINLASQSSDFLVYFAKDYATKNNLKLIQYSLFPENNRVSLLSLKEIDSIDDYPKSIEILNNFRIEFRKTLEKIKNLAEDK